jgi:hypothetical protein
MGFALACAVLAVFLLLWRVGASFLVGRSAATGAGSAAEKAVTLDACRRAIACCQLVMQDNSGDKTASATCNNLSNVPPSACEQALTTYKKSASLRGVACE